MGRAAIDWARITASTHDPDDLTPGTVLFLLRECMHVNEPAVRIAVEQGLTRALRAAHADADPCRRIEWIRLLVEARDFSDDERLEHEAMRALGDAVDTLETHIRHAYEPGDGLLGASCADELRCACALLAAFDVTGRVPYAMLAEELVRHARRVWWNRDAALFADAVGATCSGLRAMSRLLALHREPAYRASAVLARSDELADDAGRAATQLETLALRFPREAGELGLALTEWFALESDLQ